jgi:DNA-directed RNA polymerase subunit beta
MKTVSDNILEEVVKNAEFTNADVLKRFYTTDEVVVEKSRLFVRVKTEGETNLKGMRAEEDIKDNNEIVVSHGKKITASALKELRKLGIERVEVSAADFENAIALDDVINTETGEVILEANSELSAAKLQQIVEEGVAGFSVFFPENDAIGSIILQTLKKDALRNLLTRCSKFTAKCDRETRRPCRRLTVCSKECFSTLDVLIYPVSVASSLISKWADPNARI